VSILPLPEEEELREISRAVSRFCAARAPEALAAERAGSFPRAAWEELAALGVLGLGTPSGVGGVAEIVVAMEALGRANFPGPLVATFVAARLLDGQDRARVVAGELVATVGAPPLVAWAPHADRFIEARDGRAWLAVSRGQVARVATLGGEPWGELALDRTRDLGDARIACATGDVAFGAYLAGAGAALLEAAAAHARTRTQFGKPIGAFQAVSHPLASALVGLRAACALASSAARALDASAPRATALAAAARLSAVRAALAAAYAAPQTFGALGVLLEGPVFGHVRRIRQWASLRDERARAEGELLSSFSEEGS
jgi:alkylation response protein AidB-like acyl-CoA dehydrogenase